MDRTKLGEEHCYPSPKSADWWPFELNYTKTNCDLFMMQTNLNCSMLDFYVARFDSSNSTTNQRLAKVPVCDPQSMLQAARLMMAAQNPENMTDKDYNLIGCKHLCEEEEYKVSRTSGPMNESKLLNFNDGKEVG